MTTGERQLVAVIDFGGGHAGPLARQIRALQVYSEIWPPSVLAERCQTRRPRALVFSGPVPEGTATSIVGESQTLPRLTVPDSITDEALAHFLFTEAHLERTWSMESFIAEIIPHIREEVGSGKLICGFSGGIDSVVAAVLVHKAVGKQLTNIFVDQGLMRLGEPEEIAEVFGRQMGLQLVIVDARRRFLDALQGITDPEQKRKIIGTEFIRVFEEEARRVGDASFLVQGTIYPDVVESGVGGALVKSHHNVGGLPDDMALKLIEPLRQLYKDEVREIGRLLGLPDPIVNRHAFPGPGLAVRCLGEITEEKLNVLRQADAVFIDEIRQANLYNSIWQAFAVLPDIQTVGVSAGKRTYAHLIAIRAVHSIDTATAEWVRLPHELLDRIAQRIIKEVPGVNRVVYDITSKPPGTIEWE